MKGREAEARRGRKMSLVAKFKGHQRVKSGLPLCLVHLEFDPGRPEIRSPRGCVIHSETNAGLDPLVLRRPKA